MEWGAGRVLLVASWPRVELDSPDGSGRVRVTVRRELYFEVDDIMKVPDGYSGKWKRSKWGRSDVVYNVIVL